MPYFDVFSPSRVRDVRDIALTLDAPNWMMALRGFLQSVGQDPNDLQGMMCDSRADGSLVLTFPSSNRWFRILPREHAGASLSHVGDLDDHPGSLTSKKVVTAEHLELRPIATESTPQLAETPEEENRAAVTHPELPMPSSVLEPDKVAPSADERSQLVESQAGEPEAKASTQGEYAPDVILPQASSLKQHDQGSESEKGTGLGSLSAQGTEQPPESDPMQVAHVNAPEISGRLPERMPAEHPDKPDQVEKSGTRSALQVEQILEEIFDRSSDFFSSDINIDLVVSMFLDLAMDKIPSQAGAFYVADISSHDLQYAALRSPRARKVLASGKRMSMGEGVAGLCAQESITLCINDLPRYPDLHEDVTFLSGMQSTSTLCVSIARDGRCFGAIQLVDRLADDGFDRDDVSILEAIAHHVAEILSRVVE